MIILTQKRAQVTLLKLNTSPDYQGMNSRAFSKKVSAKIEVYQNRSRTQPFHPGPMKTSRG